MSNVQERIPAATQSDANPIIVYIRGAERAYTPEEIVAAARKAALTRSPNFGLRDAEVVVSVDIRQTNRLAAVFFSHGIGRPMIRAAIARDGTVAAYSEAIAEDRVIIDLK